MQPPFTRNRTRRAGSPAPVSEGNVNGIGLNSELETFLNLNASEAYKRPWHRLERGLRLNRIRKFVESEAARMSMSALDAEALKTKLEKALDKKMLNSKSCVVYDPEKEEIQEIKGLIYHKSADGRIMSSIVDKKVGVTFRKKTKAESNSAQQQEVKSDVQTSP